jgi:hypothetical protein
MDKLMKQELEDPRRNFLVQALSLGLYSTALSTGFYSSAFAMGDIPSKLPAGRSIYKLKGRVTVDGVEANINTRIRANSLVKTGDNSRIIFVVGKDAFILRSNGELQLGGDGFLLSGMRMLSGKLLSVFGKRTQPYKLQTVTATIGIRGTGIYIEADAEQSYVCTCYGHTLIASADDPSQQQEVISKHHDQPLYILPTGAGKVIRPAPFINHTDVELALIEELVGRSVPFAFSGGAYDQPRKRSY